MLFLLLFCPGGGEVIYKQAMDQISEAFTKASGANDSGVMETLILSMGNVGVSVSRDSTPVVVISLFNCFVTQDKCLASLAADQIQSIARAQKMSYHSLFTANKSQICHMMVQKVLRSLEEEGSDYQCVTDEFISIAKLFEFPDVKAYLNVSLKLKHKSQISLLLNEKVGVYSRPESRYKEFSMLLKF